MKWTNTPHRATLLALRSDGSKAGPSLLVYMMIQREADILSGPAQDELELFEWIPRIIHDVLFRIP